MPQPALMKRVQFSHSPIPYLFVLPQILIIGVFFLWPSLEAFRLSFFLEDPWGLSNQFVWFENYTTIFEDPDYQSVFGATVVFSVVVTFLSIGIALLLAVKVDGLLRFSMQYRPLLTWAYAVAPAVAGLVARFLYSPQIGPLYDLLNAGTDGWFEPRLDPMDAWLVLISGSVWKQISVNFIFILAGLQAIPRTVLEAALLDNPNGGRRFLSITLPLLAPTLFFLLVINISYAVFETFGVIDTVYPFGPPAGAETLVYKVYVDGFKGADLGGSSAQSVILMVIVLVLTMIQFKYIEKRVHYT